MKRFIYILSILSLLIVAGTLWAISSSTPATAGGVGSFETVATQTSTADQTLLAAPGANYSWVITSLWYNVDVAEAAKEVRIEDLAGTPIVAAAIPLTIAKEGMITFDGGVMFSTNSAVQCDFTSTTASAAFVVSAYKIYNP